MNELLDAGYELLHSTDCVQQSLLCELGKISNIVLSMSKAYKGGDPGLGDGEELESDLSSDRDSHSE